MSKLELGQQLKLNLTVGAETFDLRGLVHVSRSYSVISQELGDKDFMIMPEAVNLMLVKMDKLFRLGEKGPFEPVLPGDPEYEEEFGVT